MVTRGIEGTGIATVIATVRPGGAEGLRQRREGVRVVSLERGTESDTFTDAAWLLGGVKSLSYALNMAALREAVRRGAEDAVWVARDGTVLEAPTATVIWIRGRRLSTTPVGGTGILPGTTMAAVFDGARSDGFETAVERTSLEDLGTADGIWLVSAIRGVAEVIELDGVARPLQTAISRQLNSFADF